MADKGRIKRKTKLYVDNSVTQPKESFTPPPAKEVRSEPNVVVESDMEKDFAPKDKSIKAAEFNPLISAAVDEKAYTLGIGVSSKAEEPNGAEFAEEIPEQQFIAPPIIGSESAEPTVQDVVYDDDVEEPTPNEGGGSGSGGSGGGGSRISSEEDDDDGMDELSDKEKKDGAVFLANTLIGAYATYIPKIYTNFSVISPKRARKLHETGQLNLNQEIVYPDGRRVTVGGQIDGNNSRLENAYAVTQEWVNDIRKPLIKELMKRKVKVTYMEQILIKVAEHNIACIQQLVGIRKDNKDFLDMMCDLKRQSDAKLQGQYNTHPAPPAAPPQQTTIITPPPTPQAPAQNIPNAEQVQQPPMVVPTQDVQTTGTTVIPDEGDVLKG